MASLDRFPAVRELAESCHTDLPWAFAHPPRDQTLDAHFSSLRAHNSPIHKRKERSISPPSALNVPTTGASGACGSEIAGPWKTQTCNAAPFASSGQCPPPLVFVADCPHDCAADSWRFAEYATPRDVFRPLPDDFRQRSAAAAAAAAMRETGAGAAEMTPESLEVRSLASEIPPTFWEAQQAQKQQRPHTVPRTGVPYFRSSSGSSRRAPGSPLGGDGISKNRAGNALGRARAQLQGARGSRSLAARALLHGSARERSGKRGGFDDGAVINGGDAAASAATGTSSPLPSRKFLARTFSGSVEWPSRLESLFMRPGSGKGKALGDTSSRAGFFMGSGRKLHGYIDENEEAETTGVQRSRSEIMKGVRGRILPQDVDESEEGIDGSADGDLEVPQIVTCFGRSR